MYAHAPAGWLLLAACVLLVCVHPCWARPAPPVPQSVDCSAVSGADAAQSPVDVVAGLLNRLLPDHAASFRLVLQDNSSGELDTFTLTTATAGSGSDVVVTVTGNSAIALASGVHHYLKQFCNCSVSWSGDQLRLPSPLPALAAPVQVATPFPLRYYMNTCTYGYSMVWWQWERWEREIDWMALNGINFPLAFEGQEYLWLHTFMKFNVSQDDLLQWFTGPAYLPWQRMGNVNGLAGPLSLSWLTSHAQLQCRILARMRAFGMRPILPGFAGHVPPQLATLYPNAPIRQLAAWNGFEGTYFLDPMCDLYLAIQKEFITEQIALYGTDHYYNIDPFNEELPPSNDPAYLRNVSSQLYHSISEADPDAVWVLQGWFLHNEQTFWQPAQTEAFFTQIPPGSGIVLDLYAEAFPLYNTTHEFYGVPFIWCMLHNFGGRSGLYGELDRVNNGPAAAYKQAGKQMLGVGLTMEAIDTNYFQYEFMLEFVWRPAPVDDIPSWLARYAARRYGSDDAHVSSAMALLADSVLNCSTGQSGPSGSLVVGRPGFNLTQVSCCDKMALYYDPRAVEEALRLYLDASATVQQSPLYRYDLTELAAQVLSNKMLALYTQLQYYYQTADLSGTIATGVAMRAVVGDMEALLSSDAQHLVGTWLAAAGAWGNGTDADAALLDFNARNQITLWGPGDSKLIEYAYKLWGGITGDLYLSRWTLFTNMVSDAVANGRPFDTGAWNSKVTAMDVAWGQDRGKGYPTTPSGNTLLIAQRIYSTWCT